MSTPDHSPSPVDHARRTAPASAWVTSTYFAEGFPYSIVNNLADVLFVAQKATLEQVGLTSLFHLPWNLKFLVGPLLDEYGTKRSWLVAIEVLLVVALLGLAFASWIPQVLVASSIAFLVLAVLSALHDIAIDGLYLEALDKEQQARLVGVRAPAYRAAIIVVTGPLVYASGHLGFPAVFLLCAVVMGALLAFHALGLPRQERARQTFADLGRATASLRFFVFVVVLIGLAQGIRMLLDSAAWSALRTAVATRAPAFAGRLAKLDVTEWLVLGMLIALIVLSLSAGALTRRAQASHSFFARAYTSFLAQPHARRILAYVVLFRVGESFLMKMKLPFCKNALGITTDEYGIVNGGIGMATGLLAPALGGWLISRHGLRRWAWPFQWAMNGLHLVFAVGAMFAGSIVAARTPLWGAVDVRLVVVTAMIVIETIGAGLGTAMLMVYIMRCCAPEHRAAHMAILTSLMSVSFTLAGVLSGFLADALGFPMYFAFTFLVTLPGMALTLFVPHIDEPGAPPRLRP